MSNLPDPFDEPQFGMEDYAAFPILGDDDGGQIPASHMQNIDTPRELEDMQTIRFLMKTSPSPQIDNTPVASSEDDFIDPFVETGTAEPTATPTEPTSQLGTTDADSFLKTKLINADVEILPEDPDLFDQVLVPINANDNADQELALSKLHTQLVELGIISQSEVASIEALFPGLITTPIAGFTTSPSLVNYKSSMESVFGRIKEILMNGIERILEMIRNIGRWIRSKFDKNVRDKLRRYDPSDLRANREKLLAKAKALDSQHGVTIVKEIIDPSVKVDTRSSAYLYCFEWLNVVTHNALNQRYTTGMRLIIENRVPSHVGDLKSLIESELTSAKGYLDKLNSSDVKLWTHVTTPNLPTRELNNIVGFWGAVGKNTTTFSSYIEDYRTNVREAFKLETSHAPRDFQRASSYSAPYGDMGKFLSSVEGRISDLERSANKLKSKISASKDLPSDATGRFNLVTERITFIQNLLGMYKTIYNYYLTIYATINRPMVGMAIRLDAVYKKGKASEMIKQHM